MYVRYALVQITKNMFDTVLLDFTPLTTMKLCIAQLLLSTAHKLDEK